MYENKKILILGAAKSGIAVARLLANRNNDITITDLNEIEDSVKEELSNLNIKVIITKNQLDLIDSSWDIIIKNPAIMSTSSLIKKCEELNLRVENELEVAYHFLPKNIKIIGVTGSNGKTTTTTIIYNMLKCLGKSVVLGGNIGTPLAQLVSEVKDKDILLLEISDHQLCDIHDFKTNISVLTNICPTHLDYHGTYEHYKKTKEKIFNKYTKDDLAIINFDNEDALNASKNIASQKEYFSSKGNANARAYLENDGIYLDNKLIIKTDEIKLKGIHNYENIMAAILVCERFDLNIDKIKDFLANFNGVEQRLEFVRRINNVDYYNDSKSTNPTSTITALKTFDNPIHLILGGLNRNQDYHELDEYMKNVKCIYAIGETTDIVAEYAKSIKINCFKCQTLQNAMLKIKENVEPKEIVLLSPGSSSQDQYPHFEDRGNEFKNIVEKL